MSRAWTEDEIRGLGVRTNLETAAEVWGMGRTKAYELARAGEFPSPVVRIGARYVVPVAPLLRALGLGPDATPEEVTPELPSNVRTLQAVSE